MDNTKENTCISFYGKHNISPVRQDISDFNRHLSRREKLFRTLGLPHMLFSGKSVLEVGPGSGHNSLVFFEWGANVDFVEPNPKGQEGICELLDKYDVVKEQWNLFRCRIEEFNTEKKYDVILAEGFIPILYNRSEVISKIVDLVKPGGIVVVTCMDDLSFFFEVLKRTIGHRLLQKKKIESFEKRVEILCNAFSSHLKSLKSSSRLLEDWVTDIFLTPPIIGKILSIAECVEEFGNQFMILGTSPSMFTDYSWYKDVDYDLTKMNSIQFQEKRHVLMMYDLEESVRTVESNRNLVKYAYDFRNLVGSVEHDLNEKNTKEIVEVLRNISTITSEIDVRISDAISEGIMLLLDEDLNESKILNASKLAIAFGRGQQYVSLVKNVIA
ncbi:MAG: hypothetical protein CMN79_04295 [Spirochaetales bacterium]|jgi:2-polyprenyl-3-methyl-5-hydroxy-6-metoxy-1,4-benzoquinol methylase|nr:hypothetical protein [Spirochaetales bacterium]